MKQPPNISGLDAQHLLFYVVRPTLEYLDLPGGLVAERLVMGTACQESQLTYLKQIGTGPALGLFQMEPTTFHDLWRRFAARSEKGEGTNLGWKLLQLGQSTLRPAHSSGSATAVEEPYLTRSLTFNLALAAAMCRIHYYARPFTMPLSATTAELAMIWKTHYNTVLGKGKPGDFVRNYNRFLVPRCYSEY